MVAKVKRSFDSSDIYIEERVAEWENSRLSPRGVLNR